VKHSFLFIFVMVLLTTPVWAEPAHPGYQEARALLAEGDFAGARDRLELILEDSALSGDERSEVEKELFSLNLQILFSKTETPTSLFHTVEKGDSLYKIARKYSTTIELLRRANGISGDVIYPGVKLKVEQGNFTVLVDKSDNTLDLFLEGKRIKRYRVATGENNKTPVGTFKVINKLKDPTWFHAGAVVPPDSPENILGTRWMGFDNPGYGIHGTTLPQSIGTQATAGCVRMWNREVEELYGILPVGTKVTVVD